MYEPKPIRDRPAGLGFPHRAGRYQLLGIVGYYLLSVFVPGLSRL